MRDRALAVPAVVLAIALAAPAAAATEPEAPARDELGTRHLAIGASILKELGFGGFVRLRTKYVGVEGALTWNPYVMFVPKMCKGVQVGGSMRWVISALGFFGETEGLEHGIRIAGMKDDLWQWGVQIGYQAEYPLLDWLVLQAGLGVHVFPEANKMARRRMDRSCQGKTVSRRRIITSPVQLSYGIGLMVYLF